ncbi:MAG: universal stress protein [Dehalococcoidia bacterium]
MRILIPVDGTSECETAIPTAQQMASALDAEIYLVRVVEAGDAISPVRFDSEAFRVMQEAERYLGELASRFKLSAERTRRIVGRGQDTSKEIISIAQGKGIDLIVMATHCKGLLERLTRGSVYHGVLRSQACPVLGVPLPAQSGRRGRRTAAALRK